MATIMRTAYPLNTEVLLLDKIPARITAVTFYHNYEKYLLSRINDGSVVEEWHEDSYFTLWEIKKIGFDL